MKYMYQVLFDGTPIVQISLSLHPKQNENQVRTKEESVGISFFWRAEKESHRWK